MSGFFPVMMFGLPAACLAMWRSARPERRAAVGGMLASLALTSFLTGVTEPIEFSFMFLAPALYALHAVLTGASMVLMNALGVRLGFSFSAGLFDYVINFGKASRPLLLIPVGLAYAGVYYAAFRFAIVRFDLKTPGREPEGEATVAVRSDVPRGRAFVDALGGAANLASVDACTTRLRLVVADQTRVDEPALKGLGARGLVRPSPKDLQVVLGPIADEVAREMRAALANAPAATLATISAPAVQSAELPAGPADAVTAAGLLAALGGPQNLTGVDAVANRLLITLANLTGVDEPALKALGVRAIARTGASRLQLILGEDAAPLGGALAQRA
jgi:PTS system N-acetylglucosamine-specific IIC component